MRKRDAHVAFLIRSLDFGGAEKQLVLLATSLHRTGTKVSVITYYPGKLDPELDKAGVPRYNLEKRGRWDLLFFIIRLIRLLKSLRPSVIHGYMDIANILGLFIGRIFLNCRVVWGIRASYVDFRNYSWIIKFANRVEAWLSKFPDLIITNSFTSKSLLITNGYPANKIHVIHNGIDTQKFQIRPDKRMEFRKQHGIPDNAFLIGTVGRLDPQKDHKNFIKAASIISSKMQNTYFMIVGSGTLQEDLIKLSNSIGLGDRLIFVPAQSKIEFVYPGFDIFVLNSLGESFPNVLAEAMACGVCAMSTDVGDAKVILGDYGIFIEKENPERLSENIINALTKIESHDTILKRAKYISDNFSIHVLCETSKGLIVGQ